MKNKKWYEWMLTAVYFAMVVVCVLLNLMPGQREGLSNIIVNVAMFVIVGIIFLNCDINCFAPLDAMIDDLNAAAARIRRDALDIDGQLAKPRAVVRDEHGLARTVGGFGREDRHAGNVARGRAHHGEVAQKVAKELQPVVDLVLLAGFALVAPRADVLAAVVVGLVQLR